MKVNATAQMPAKAEAETGLQNNRFVILAGTTDPTRSTTETNKHTTAKPETRTDKHVKSASPDEPQKDGKMNSKLNSTESAKDLIHPPQTRQKL